MEALRGLSSSEAAAKLRRYGPNQAAPEQPHPLRALLEERADDRGFERLAEERAGAEERDILLRPIVATHSPSQRPQSHAFASREDDGPEILAPIVRGTHRGSFAHRSVRRMSPVPIPQTPLTRNDVASRGTCQPPARGCPLSGRTTRRATSEGKTAPNRSAAAQ